MPIVDQENWPADMTSGFWSIESVWPDYAPQVLHAQTFVVGHTGTLVGLELIGLGDNPMSLDIRTQSNSHPDDGNVLQTVAIPGFAGVHAPTTVALNVAVTAGDLLSFVVSGGAGGSWGNSFFGNTDGYANGGMWAAGNPQYGLDGPGSWYPNGNTGIEHDFFFRTIVDTTAPASVPEPGTPLLFLSALGIIGMASARRARR
jgi:hypothetical protein